MTIVLDGSSQYISLGNGVNVYSARPYTYAALVNCDLIRATGSWNALYCQGDYSDSGWGVEIEAVTAANRNLYHTWTGAGGLHENYSTWTIPAASGWWLFMVVHRDTGAGSAVDFYGYRYATRALSQGTAGGGGSADEDPLAPGGSDPTEIGAFNDGGVIDHFRGQLGWTAIWAGDLGEAGAANPKALWEMIWYGAWRLRGPNMRLFVPHSLGMAAKDLSGYNTTTLVGGPSWYPPALTEAPPNTSRFWPVWEVADAPAASGAISGADAGTSTVSGTLTGAGALAGSTSASVTVTGTITGAGVLSGATAGSSTVSGAIVATGALSAAAAGSATVAGTMAAAGALSAASAGVASQAATLTGAGALSGATAGAATVTGNLADLTAGAMSGAIAGFGTATATLTGAGALVALVGGTTTVSATLAGTGALSAASVSASTTSATLSGSGALIAFADGAATATALLTGAGLLSGTIAGLAVVVATLADLVPPAVGLMTMTAVAYAPTPTAQGRGVTPSATARRPVPAAIGASVEPAGASGGPEPTATGRST